MISIAAGAYLFGYKTAYDRIEDAAGSYGTETFYAVITDITDSSITVQGMEINDINFRGQIYISRNGRDLLSVARDWDQPQRPGRG